MTNLSFSRPKDFAVWAIVYYKLNKAQHSFYRSTTWDDSIVNLSNVIEREVKRRKRY